MTEETVAVRTSSALPTLSKAERRVGRTLLADYPSAGLASAARLAERAEVSPPTVLRFAQSLGYDGFTDLQVALRAELSALSNGPINRLPDAPPAGGLLDRLLQQARAQNERAVETLAALPTSALEAAVALLVGHRADRLSARRTLLASAGRAPGRPPRTTAARGAVARRSGWQRHGRDARAVARRRRRAVRLSPLPAQRREPRAAGAPRGGDGAADHRRPGVPGRTRSRGGARRVEHRRTPPTRAWPRASCSPSC